ncbi:MAG TPA: YlaH-like family protein [Pseudogracilibacillus sp.]|nr:YlaH-like family protein [Pseudogracilibacillus sp.]
MIFNFIVDIFGATQTTFWVFYVLNLIFSIIAYKLGFARELPLLKSIIVYILLAFGVIIITIFSILEYPMTESLIIISLVLGIYRFRLYRDRKAR